MTWEVISDFFCFEKRLGELDLGVVGGGGNTVVGRAERRRVEFSSQDCAVGR